MAGDHVQSQEPVGTRCPPQRSARRTRNRRGEMMMDVASFKPAIVYTIYIASSPDNVWNALTSAEFSRKYFFGFGIETELKVGGSFVARAPDGSVHIGGE